MKTISKNKVKVKIGWLVEHTGMGAGIFTVYNSRAKAEYEIREALCECDAKPIKCTITYKMPIAKKEKV